MNLRRVGTGLSALLLFSGCASTRETVPDGNPPYWQIVQGAALSHIPDESDAMAIWFECRPGPVIWTQTPVFDGKDRRFIRLRSGRFSHRYTARASDDEMGESAEADLRLDDPVLQAFRATGQLTIGGGWALDAASDRELTAIETFFARCR